MTTTVHEIPPAPVKPRYRGVSHQIAFFVSPLAWGPLLVMAPNAGARVVMAVYAVAMSGLFGVSALFHRRTWGPTSRLWMRRLDHSMIYVFIAGSYTAIGAFALPHHLAVRVLTVVWVATVACVTIRMVSSRPAPKWVTSIPYLALGWVATVVMPQFLDGLGWGGFSLLILGGLMYTAGAIVYGSKRPDPAPAVFGYHEIFHAFVIAGALAHWFVVGFFALPHA